MLPQIIDSRFLERRVPLRAKINKTFQFHSAHILHNHDGQCSRLHGHTYELEVAVEGDLVATGNKSPDEGMVMDFKVLKDIYKRSVEPLVEHQNLNETLKDAVPVTTCEFLAIWIRQVFYHELITVQGRKLDSIEVKLWETPTSWAHSR